MWLNGFLSSFTENIIILTSEFFWGHRPFNADMAPPPNAGAKKSLVGALDLQMKKDGVMGIKGARGRSEVDFHFFMSVTRNFFGMKKYCL